MVNPQNGLQKNPQNKSKVDNLICNPWGLLVIVGFVLVLIFGFIRLNIFPALKLEESMDIAGLFWGTATILAIVERSIELFIAAWRNPGKKMIEQEISILQEKTFQSLPQEKKDRINEIETEIKTLDKEISKKNQEKKNNTSNLVNKRQEQNIQQNVLKGMDENAPERQEEEDKLEEIKVAINQLGLNGTTLTNNLTTLGTQKEKLEVKRLGILTIDPENKINSPALQLYIESKNLIAYETNTAYYALYLGIGFGFFASIAGIRVLQPLVDVSGLENGQLNFFYKLDLVVSALAIAGGTKLFHELPALISDTLSSTRNIVNTR